MNALGDIKSRFKGLCRVRENEPMSGFTSFRTGGLADYLLLPEGTGRIPEIVNTVREAGLPLTIIGGGTNLLVGDRGIRGAVMAIREDKDGDGGISLEGEGKIYAEASVKKERFIRFALGSGLGGTEFMAGIPGCIGGGIIMNAGTYMGWFADIVKSLVLLTSCGDTVEVPVTPEMSSYRKLRIPEGAIVIGARFILPKSDDIAGSRRCIDEILEDRKKKHPLDFPSAGSVFKNPEGHSSWQLIDRAGLKGYAIGGARVSDLHTNFIINAAGASSRDIYNLIRHVQGEVEKHYGISLETEVRMIGEF